MTSLEVLSNRTYAGLLLETRRSKLFLYLGLSLRPCRCLSHLARHWPAARRDLLLRSSFCGQRLPAGFLVRTSLLVLWLCLDVPSFRSVLAHGWHESGIVRFCCLSSVRAAAIAQDFPAPAHDCPLQVRQRPVVGRQLMPSVVQGAEAFVNNLVCCRLVTDEQFGQTCQRRAVAAMEPGYRLIAAIIVHASYFSRLDPVGWLGWLGVVSARPLRPELSARPSC
jgi:hypothetical protein